MNEKKQLCTICLNETCEYLKEYDDHSFLVQCDVCGHYRLEYGIYEDNKLNMPDAERHILSAVLRNFSTEENPIKVTVRTWKELIEEYGTLTIEDKISYLLLWIKSKTPYLNCKIKFNPTLWFNSSLEHTYEKAIKPAIQANGYKAIRIDKEHYNEKIDDQILSEIRECKFIVADFTGQRQSVYFEAGYALGQKKTVIWTCKQDDIENCHFDTRQYNHIVWGDLEEFRQNLENRITATIGRIKMEVK